MKGWEFTGTHIPLKIVEKPDPQVKPGYVVLKTKAGGLCHSDVSALEHESWMPSFNVPVIMGHEVCGEIVAKGEGVEGFEIGDVVAVCPLHAKDGTTPGYTRDGGYGTMTTAPVEQLVKVPEGVTYAQAAAATDAGATAYHAVVTVGEVKTGMKVGIIGVGKIGTMVAARLKGFGCRILGCDIFLSPEEIEKRGCEPVSKEELLKRSDFITIHMRHEAGQPALIGADEFAMMKKNAILVNCARAGLVDTAALVEALRAHRIGGAAIDVFDEEPLSADSPLLTLDNVTLTPHIAGTTVDAFANSVEIMLRQLSLVLAGETAPNRVV